VPPAPDNKYVVLSLTWLTNARVYKQTVEYVTEFSNMDQTTAENMRR